MTLTSDYALPSLGGIVISTSYSKFIFLILALKLNKFSLILLTVTLFESR